MSSQKPKQIPPSISIASVLSDLTSLRVCDLESAKALVSASTDGTSTDKTSCSDAQADSTDPDMVRARILVDLYQTVKVAYSPQPRGDGSGQAVGDVSSVSYNAHGALSEARRDVAQAVALLNRKGLD